MDWVKPNNLKWPFTASNSTANKLKQNCYSHQILHSKELKDNELLLLDGCVLQLQHTATRNLLNETHYLLILVLACPQITELQILPFVRNRFKLLKWVLRERYKNQVELQHLQHFKRSKQYRLHMYSVWERFQIWTLEMQFYISFSTSCETWKDRTKSCYTHGKHIPQSKLIQPKMEYLWQRCFFFSFFF